MSLIIQGKLEVAPGSKTEPTSGSPRRSPPGRAADRGVGCRYGIDLHETPRWVDVASAEAQRDPPAHTLRSASVGDMRAARSAGTSPATAPIDNAAPNPPAQARVGMTVVQPLAAA